jgi:hypothetical protein
MTEKKNSDDEPAHKTADIALRFAPEPDPSCLAALEALPDDEFADVVLKELDRRRLDASGNPTDAPGLYMAAATAVLGMLGLEKSAMVERLASVGRQELSGKLDNSAVIREVAEMLDANWPEMAVEAKAKMVADTLAARLQRPVDAELVASALQKTGSRKRIEWVLRAAKIETNENAIKGALKHR